MREKTNTFRSKDKGSYDQIMDTFEIEVVNHLLQKKRDVIEEKLDAVAKKMTEKVSARNSAGTHNTRCQSRNSNVAVAE